MRMCMMAGPDEGSQTIGTDRRKTKFPLRALSLTQGDSKQHPQLQLADLCAGVINHFYKCQVSGLTDGLTGAVMDLKCLDWGDNFVLPQPDVTPEALGTAETDGSNSVEAMVEYLERRKVQKRAG